MMLEILPPFCGSSSTHKGSSIYLKNVQPYPTSKIKNKQIRKQLFFHFLGSMVWNKVLDQFKTAKVTLNSKSDEQTMKNADVL